jgi:hypothetical protein
MKTRQIFARFLVLSLLLSAAVAYAATFTGTVTNKTTGKPSAGDTVVLVDVQAGMSEAATAKTDAHGHYSLNAPGMGTYLIRADHQGGSYFIAAPSGDTPGDISVYDVAAKVDGVGLDSDQILVESGGGMVRIQEHFLVRNTSLPPRAQFGSNTFEFVLPPDAVLDAASATRPGGMATNTRPVPLGPKGHYTFSVPIQPNKGEKETLFEVQYHVSSSGKLKFTPQPQMTANTVEVYLPKGIEFSAANSAAYQSVQGDPRVQTYVARNVQPGQAAAFTLSGEGQMPRDAQGAGMGQPGAGDGGMGESAAGDTANRPGGGIGNPINTPDPLSKYKWWILGLLSIGLIAAAGFLLRKRGGLPVAGSVPAQAVVYDTMPLPASAYPSASAASSSAPAYAGGNAALLNILKEELFAIESEKLSGTISPAEYAEVKAGLEAVLKRALKRK